MKKIVFILFICMCLPQALFAAATATLDRGITTLGESVQLNIVVEGNANTDPDLQVLSQDFDVLRQSQSSNYSLINGSFSRSTEWSIALMPKREGVLPIPAISLGNMMTNPLSVRVLPAGANSKAEAKDIFLEVTASAAEVYVQAQLRIDVKLYRAVNLAQAQLSEPNMPHTMVKKIGEDQNYEVVHEQRRYVVTERKYAVFPQQSGSLTIPALQFDGRVAARRGGFNQAGRAVRIKSEPIDIKVLPQPNTWTAQYWLPAEHISLHEIERNAPSNGYKVGEPFTRTIEIRARGLTAEQLPSLFADNKSHDFKQYPDQPVFKTETLADTLLGVRREKVAMIPTKAGELVLPSMSVSWWNVQTQHMETVHIAARTINVVPATEIQTEVADIAPPFTPQGSMIEHNQPARSQPEWLLLWQVLAVFFALAWLLMTWLWWLLRQQHRGSLYRSPQDQEKEKQSLKRIAKKMAFVCCKQADAKQAALLLPQWAALYLKDASIQQYSQLKGYSKALDSALEALEVALYSEHSEAETWSGHALWQALEALPKPSAKQQKNNLALPPLYAAE